MSRCQRAMRRERVVVGLAIAVGMCAAHVSTAFADGQIHVSTAVFKEEATRIIQPMTDIELEATPDLDIKAHFLIDSISSASVVAFDEIRYEAGGGADYRLDKVTLGAFGRYSYEPDYQSIFAGVRASAELAQKNTTIGLVFGMGFDEVSNQGAQGGMGGLMRGGDMDTVMASASLSQILSPNTVAGVTYDFIHMSGFLENPYRDVAVAGVLVLEEVPDTRMRHAIVGSLRQFLPVSETTLIGSYRVYVDDWDIAAHTPEIRVIQELAPDLDIHVRYRYHQQSAARFFEPIYDTLGAEFRTNDIKLSAFDTHMIGAKLDVSLKHLGFTGRLEAARIDILCNYVMQNNRFGNAVVLQAGLSYPFEY